MGYQTVWAVSSGEYSDYSVNELFTTKELAEEHAERMNARERYSDHRVEEFDLWDERPPVYVVYHRQARVHAGGVSEERSWSAEYVGRPSEGQRLQINDLGGPNGWFSVVSTDLQRLEKVWAERVAKLQAELAGI